MALGTDELRCGKTTGKTGFLSLPTCTCIVFGRVPCPEYCYIANYTVSSDGDGGGVSRARSAARALRRARSIPSVFGCAPPSTRRAVLAVSSSVVKASRRSSSVALSSLQSASAYAPPIMRSGGASRTRTRRGASRGAARRRRRSRRRAARAARTSRPCSPRTARRRPSTASNLRRPRVIINYLLYQYI